MSDPTGDRGRLESAGLRLQYLTIAWNGVEMVITLALGIAARSLALVAFGLDTVVELFASGVVVRHLHHPERGDRQVTARALRRVAGAFLLLAAAVTIGSIWALIAAADPDESPLGIAYLGLTVAAMLALGLAKRRVGARLSSQPMMAEAQMSVIDAGLALAVLIGLALNVLFGWWWADPVAALFVAVVAAREGIEHFEEAAELAGS